MLPTFLVESTEHSTLSEWTQMTGWEDTQETLQAQSLERGTVMLNALDVSMDQWKGMVEPSVGTYTL
jgi:hypothetical protein